MISFQVPGLTTAGYGSNSPAPQFQYISAERERERERAGDGGGDAVVMHDDACANKKCRTTTAMELHVLSNPDVRNLNDKIEPVLVQL